MQVCAVSRGGGSLRGLGGLACFSGDLATWEGCRLSRPTASARALLQVGRPRGLLPEQGPAIRSSEAWLLSPQSASALVSPRGQGWRVWAPGLLPRELSPSFHPQLLTRTLAWGPWGVRGGVAARRAGRAGRGVSGNCVGEAIVTAAQGSPGLWGCLCLPQVLPLGEGAGLGPALRLGRGLSGRCRPGQAPFPFCGLGD